jgi:3-oxoacyl-[acyl-carrier protein] reductase
MRKVKGILITGTSRGLGRDLAQYYLNAGYQVFGCSRSESTIQHQMYSHERGDLTHPEFAQRLVTRVFEQMPTLNSAVLNAGLVSSVLPALLISVDFAEKMFRTNAMSPIQLATLLAKKFVRLGGGSIVGISSVSVPLKLKGSSVYSASKAALETYLKILAKEVAQFNVRCNCLAPALYNSSATKNFSAKWQKDLIAQQDIQELSELSDIVNVIDFLIGKSSRMITGQTISLGFVS